MEEIFISELKINKVRHLENITIPLDKKKRKHLIITGKNGSGKTSVLEAIRNYLKIFEQELFTEYQKHISEFNQLKVQRESLQNKIQNSSNDSAKEIMRRDLQQNEKRTRDIFSWLNLYNSVELDLNLSQDLENQYNTGNFIFAHFSAKRNGNNSSSQKGIFKETRGIEKIRKEQKYTIEEKIGTNFLQYLVNLKADRSFAKDENDTKTVNLIDEWFVRFEKMLSVVFEEDFLGLEFDRQNYSFDLKLKNREKVSLNELSDGYSSILDILSELIMRMEDKIGKNYNTQGIVLIDEIESHLHISLQEKILPFLTAFFPKIQFIVTTHSPFVLNSIEDTVIYDLENHTRLEDVSDVSFQGLVKNYFKISSEYSNILEKKIADYEQLMTKINDLTTEETERLGELDIELDNLSPLLASDIYLRFKQVQKNIFAEKE